MECSTRARLSLAALIMMLLSNITASASPAGKNGSITPMMSSPPNKVTANGPAGSITQETVADILPVKGQLSNATAIGSFLDQLTYPSGKSLNILQIGDSHTAGRKFTGAWRSAWQARYGSGGRGMMTVGSPYRGYLTQGVTTSQSPGWRTTDLFDNGASGDRLPLGLSGFTLTANSPFETASLTADTPELMFDKFYLCGLTGPGMGDVSVKLGSTEHHLSFSSHQAGAACFEAQAPSLVQSVIVETLSARPVSLTSWMTQRSTGGVILSNLGVVGARFEHFARTDDKVIEAELRQLKPDLLVVAYGTNEGFLRELDLTKVKSVIINQIARVRQLLGYDVPILLLGPPDVLKPKSKVPSADEPALINSSCVNGMRVPENVSRVRLLQKDLANQEGFAFWDWQGAMGGPCSSVRWVSNSMQMRDYVHFTATGGSLLGTALADDLERAKAESVLK